MRTLILTLFFVTFANTVSVYDVIQEEWNSYKSQYDKEYQNEIEEKFRMKIFLENKHKIAKHNQKYERGEVSFKLGLNKYADMLHQEFVQIMNGFNSSAVATKFSGRRRESGVTFISPANVELPHAIDWRTKGAVTPVKDQGRCGSCWAFSSTGSLESQHFRVTGNLISLSEQNLVDCSSSYGNDGCNGGQMANAFRYIKENGGVDTEKSYPYDGIENSCHFNKHSIGATDKGFVEIPEGDEEKLKQALATTGPISVAIDASHESFQFYTDGVYFEPSCNSEETDHAVLAIGYGTDKAGVDYWLVKNSWGTSWGEEGYIKIARNRDNHCGIASSAVYPLV